MAVIDGEYMQVAHSQSAARDIGKLWRHTPEESKQIFHQKAEQDRLRYDREMEQQKRKMLLKQTTKVSTKSSCGRKRTDRDPPIRPTSTSSIAPEPLPLQQKADTKIQTPNIRPRKLFKFSEISVTPETLPLAIVSGSTTPPMKKKELQSREKLHFPPLSSKSVDVVKKDSKMRNVVPETSCIPSKAEPITASESVGVDSVDFGLLNWDEVVGKDPNLSMDWLDLPFPAFPSFQPSSFSFSSEGELS